ncbi:MAG TPA: hypothetical protein VIL30_17595 [Ramlibacter sp.]|jgi:hypothetical protein
MHRTRICIAAFAALAAAAFAVAQPIASVANRSWRRTIDMIENIGAWLVARMPKARSGWLDAWHPLHVLAKSKIHAFSGAQRRPQVSPRWRMCPSV